MRQPFTPTQFKVLEAAFYGDAGNARIETRRVLTRTINALRADGYLYSRDINFRHTLTPSGLRAYVDMCERRDANSGCIAYQQRAAEARAALADLAVPA